MNCRRNCGGQVGGAQDYPCRTELRALKAALRELERCLIAAAEEEETPTPPVRPCHCYCCYCCCHRVNQTTYGR